MQKHLAMQISMDFYCFDPFSAEKILPLIPSAKPFMQNLGSITVAVYVTFFLTAV